MLQEMGESCGFAVAHGCGSGGSSIPAVFDNSALLLESDHSRICPGHGSICHLETISEFVRQASGCRVARSLRLLLYLPLSGGEPRGPREPALSPGTSVACDRAVLACAGRPGAISEVAADCRGRQLFSLSVPSLSHSTC